ncbi:N-glycosylase/DNA lyase [Plakobranchus ocellatus]|uniref:N-glycosylase/DNA lyase n=1 Tax=Plakobranchus ocellatus TaxID=259542 RepID=A0AAV4D6S9_9GAST|nr:N-glycosylase/DNA lyase [Plakobranchus ocellatus]
MAASLHGTLACSSSQLCLNTVLVSGQSFRWKQNFLGEWLGVFSGCVWRLKQTDEKILYQVYASESQRPGFTDTEGVKFSEMATHLSGDPKDLPQKGRSETTKLRSRLSTRKLRLEKSCDGSVKGFTDGKTIKLESDSSCTNFHGIENGSKKNIKFASNFKMAKVHASVSTPGCLKSFICDTFTSKEYSDILYDYFQLDIDLDEMYRQWSSRDPHFAKVASHFKGVRMLRQDPVENLLSFVCSSNNHISRISNMVEKLCTHYGSYITTVDGEKYYSFPSLDALCGDSVETHLRELGFGYRAKFIANIAQHVTREKGGDEWVRSLRGKSYAEAKSELMSLLGVGAKVADCVCLMSLDQPGAIPVDTHVWQITLKHYMAKLNTAKSLTDKIYNEIDLKQNKDRAAMVEADSKSTKGRAVNTASRKRKLEGQAVDRAGKKKER